MAHRRRKRYSHSPGQRIKAQSLRRSPTFIGLLFVIAAFALFIITQNQGDGPILSGEFVVHFIDVGQGDSILIQTPDNEFMLIDTGEDSHHSKLSSYLEKFGVEEFKYVVFTHPHSDHIGSAYKIVQDYKIDKLIMPRVMHDTTTFERLIEAIENTPDFGITPAEAGDTYYLGEAEFIILAPLSEEYNNLNNYSVVILLKYGNTKFLFTGDMEKQSEDEVFRQCDELNVDIRADVLKVAHHGSSTSTQSRFLNLIRPKISVIQVGENNRHNHPNAQTVERLENMKSEILRNDWYGDIMISSNGRDLTVYTSKGEYNGKYMPIEEDE